MVLSWGKCKAFLRRIDQVKKGAFIQLPTPVQNTTKLTPTQGTKKEAKIEGGENEAVRYEKNTNQLALNIRGAKGRRRPLKDSDGIVEGEYEVFIQPENVEGTGVYLPKVNINAQGSFDTEEGLVWPYTMDTVTPDDGGEQVREGLVEVEYDQATKKVKSITFTEFGKGDEEDKEPVTFEADEAAQVQAAPSGQEEPGTGE